MTAEQVRRVLFRCDGAPVPATWAAQQWEAHREIRADGPDADLDLRLESLSGVLLADVGPRSADLVRIAAYAYAADQRESRGGPRDAHAARWKRHLALCIPVEDPIYWSHPGVAEGLAATLRFLTDDAWEFAFAPASHEVRQPTLNIRPQEVLGRPGAIVSFSGGADSLCVLLEAAANGERPVAVGHWSTTVHQSRQESLLDGARQRLRSWNFPRVGFRIHRRGGDPADYSQRTRAFLFASLSATVAGESGVERVYLGDNGPVSLNLPINDQLVGALASRSTHPEFLRRFNRLVAGLFPAPVVVSNPLAGRTRAEALGVLAATGCVDLLPLTLSCSKWRGLPAATPHCGGCSQCVDRRFATVAAGLEAHDPAGRYKRDVFLDDLEEWDARTTAVSYVRFAQRAYRMGDEELVEAFPQLYDAAAADDRDPEAALREAIALTKHHAATVLGALKAVGDRNLDALFEDRLPAGCLLRLAAAGHGADLRVSTIPPAHPRPETSGPEHNGPTDAPAENVFAYAGEMWTVSYRGATAYLKPNVGLARIACLLERPRRVFTAAEVLVTTEPPPETNAPIAEADARRQDLWSEPYAGGGTKLDEKAATALRNEIGELLREIDDARDEGDQEREVALDARMKDLVRELSAGVGLGGKLRPFADNLSRRQGTVYQSIHRIIPRIVKAHPVLGEHLDRAVKRGTAFSYQPEGDVRWHVRLPHTQA